MKTGYERTDEIQFTKDVFEAKKQIEENLDPKKRIFLDRGLPGSIAYLLMEGRDWSDPLVQRMRKDSKKRVYSKIYILEPLSFFEAQSERPENIEFARKAYEKHVEVYKKLGYKPKIVPVLPPKERIDYVLNDILGKGR